MELELVANEQGRRIGNLFTTIMPSVREDAAFAHFASQFQRFLPARDDVRCPCASITTFRLKRGQLWMRATVRSLGKLRYVPAAQFSSDASPFPPARYGRCLPPDVR